MSEKKNPVPGHISDGAAVIITVMAFLVLMLGLSALGLLLIKAIVGILS